MNSGENLIQKMMDAIERLPDLNKNGAYYARAGMLRKVWGFDPGSEFDDDRIMLVPFDPEKPVIPADRDRIIGFDADGPRRVRDVE